MRTSIALALGLLALVLAWRLTPLGDLVAPARVLAEARALRELGPLSALAPLAFALLSVALCPLVVLRVTTVVVFGPVLGPIYAIVGVALATFAGHALGARYGHAGLARLAGPRLERVRAFIERRRGVLAVAALRLVPLGPFTLVNVAAGAAQLRRRDVVAGTVLGLMPGLIVITLGAASFERMLMA